MSGLGHLGGVYPSQGCCGTGMRVESATLGHRLADGRAHRRVPEAVLARGPSGHEQPGVHQLVEAAGPGRGSETGGVCGDVDDERITEHRSGLDEESGCCPEAAHFGAHSRENPQRDRGIEAGTVQLGEQQRVAAGGLEQLRALGLAASVEQLDGVLRPQGRDFEEVERPGGGARCRDHCLGHLAGTQRQQHEVCADRRVTHDRVEQLEGRRVGPVHVVERDQCGRAVRWSVEPARQVAEELPALLDLLRWGLGEPVEQREGHVSLVLGGSSRPQLETTICCMVAGEREQAGLADPRLTKQDEHSGLARGHGVERGVQHGQLAVPAHQVHPPSIATRPRVWVGKPPMFSAVGSVTLEKSPVTEQRSTT